MRLISEGIGHLDDLDIDEFIDIIKNIATQEISEKIDGSNLAFGLDTKGIFYTTRTAKSKNTKLIYNVKDYPSFSTFNGFRAAHVALSTQIALIKEVLQPGDIIEIEVVVGNQPNVVSYSSDGLNYILFLRPLNDTSYETFTALINKLKDKQASIDSKVIISTDGKSLSSEDKSQTFIFSAPQKIDPTALKNKTVDAQIKKLEKFLAQNSTVKNLTNMELLSVSLASIKTDERADVKNKKTELIAVINSEFKLPIKQELLNGIFSKLKSNIYADEGNDIGIEGAVLLDKNTGKQVKIVDKDTYSTVNQFNHTVRAQIMGVVKTTDTNAALDDQGGVIGNMKIKIADLFGDKDFAKGAVIKKALSRIDGKTPKDIVVNFTKTLNLPEDFNGIKRKILAIISATNKELSAQRDDFSSSNEKYQLKLKTGKIIQLSPEVISRTLTSFAEASAGVRELFDKIKQTDSYEQIIAIFYGKYINEKTPVTESLLLEKKYQTDKKMYQGKDAWTLLNIYLATALAAVLMYKADDKMGMRLLKDKAHFRMKKWTAVMGPLNFWGLAIWRSTSPPIKKLIGTKASNEIFSTVKRIPKLWWLNLHLDLSFGRDAPIHWDDHLKTLKYLQWHPNLKMERINFLINNAFKYELLTFDEKIKFLNKLYYYVSQFVPSSPLLIRVRNIQHSILLNPPGIQSGVKIVGEHLLKIVNAKLEEDAEGIATDSGSIASVESPINIKIIRRQRNPNFARQKPRILKVVK